MLNGGFDKVIERIPHHEVEQMLNYLKITGLQVGPNPFCARGRQGTRLGPEGQI